MIFQRTIDRYIEYMRDKQTPVGLQNRVLDYLHYWNNSRYTWNDEDEGESTEVMQIDVYARGADAIEIDGRTLTRASPAIKSRL